MKRITTITLTLTFACISTTTFAQSFNNPESVEYDAANQRYLISNPGSGQILADDTQGNLSVFATGLPSGPHGLEILGNTLYACSGGSLRGFDLTTGNQTVNVNFGASFLNGITTDGVDHLFITDFSNREIYRFNATTQVFNVMASHPSASPNGIVYDGPNNRLVFVEWGSSADVNAISLADSSITEVAATNFSNIDGIVMDGDGNFYICPWSTDKLYAFNNSFTAGPSEVASNLNNPADIDYNATDDVIAVPNSGDNTVSYISLAGFTAIGQTPDQNKMEIYSNGNTVYINTNENIGPESHVVIYDLQGREVQLRNLTANNTRIEMRKAGLYLVQVVTASGTTVRKVVTGQ